jgi:enolase-phosphatase E1
VPPAPDSLNVRAVLLDIEGTTTPIDFVFRTLFPYASEHVEEFLRQGSSDPELQTLIAELRSTWSGAACSGAPVWIESTAKEKLASAAAYVRWLIERDSKITPLKALEGKIWEQGFRTGALQGEVYPDVAPAFARWREQGRLIAIFSSGSVLAQKLLFAHSTAGDLSSYLQAYFDTTTGPKRDPASYKKIAALLELPPRQVLFLSDVSAELDAAAGAHMQTAHSLRPGVPEPESRTHQVIRTFDEVLAD